MSKVGYVYDPLFLEHSVDGHPENAGRLQTIVSHLQEAGLIQMLTAIQPRDATDAEIALIHDQGLVEQVRRASEAGRLTWLDPDTYVTPDSYRVAVRAAGSCLAALQAVLEGRVESAFCLVRPPGHHATPTRAMGFCLFNSLAIAAGFALQQYGLERIAIVDFDVHHGNGTQDAFAADSRVFYFSSHQYPFYPGTGHWREMGKGNIANVPLPAGCGDPEFLQAYREVCFPLLRRFRPQALLVSAGFDAHFADPLAQLRVSTRGYYQLTSDLRDLARELCSGRTLFALEGGYHHTALPWSVRACFDALLDRPFAEDPLGDVGNIPGPDLQETLASVKRLHGL